MEAGAGSAGGGRAAPIAEQARTFARDLRPTDRARAEGALGSLCSQLRHTGQAPLLDEYVRQSPVCVELFELLESQDSDGGRAIALVLEVLAFVLEGAFAEGAQTARTRSGVAGRILSGRLQGIYRCLSSERDQLLKACLRVLAGVVSQSSAFALQMLRSFNFAQEGFLRLAGRRSKKRKESGKGPEDVRDCFVRFALSFLKWRDPAITGPALLVKGFYSHIFGGLKDDDAPHAISFLEQIRELVLSHRQLPRGSKLFLFSGFVLRRLCGLLSAEEDEVVECVQRFLCELCADTFLFRPQQRQLLLELCLDLRPLKGPQQEVVSVVLRTHPGVHLHFLSNFQLSLQPRLSEQWVRNLRFVIQLLEMDARLLPCEAAYAAEGQEVGAEELKLSWMMHIFAPRAMQKTLLTQALMHQDLRIMFAALLLLSAQLGRIRRAAGDGSIEPGQVEELLKRLQQVVPDLNTLLLLWQRLVQDQRPHSAAETKHGRKRKKEKVELEEWQQVAGEDAADEEEEEEELDDSTVCRLLGRPEAAITQHVVFDTWCATVKEYIEVLPRSALDVKFDWSKLLSTVASPLLQGKQGNAEVAGAASRLVPCIACVEAATSSGGRLRGLMQLSKSHLAFVESLLRVRGAVKKQVSDDLASDVRGACDAALHRFFRDLGVFGVEDSAEVCVWLQQLEQRPQCISFFCDVLRGATSKPGTFAGLVDTGLATASGGADVLAPSLFLVVAIKQLVRKEGQAKQTPSSCAQFVRAAGYQLALVLLPVAPSMLALVRDLGEWAVHDGEGETAAAPEALRKELIERLEGVCGTWGLSASSSARAAAAEDSRSLKRRRLQDAKVPQVDRSRCAGSLVEALRNTLPLADDTVGEDPACDDSLIGLRDVVARSVDAGEPQAHCGVYVLMAGAATMLSAAACDFRLAMWYLVLLFELLPSLSAVSSASSTALRHVLAHPLWPLLVTGSSSSLGTLPSAKGSSDHGKELGVCIALAFGFLCELLMAHLDSSTSGTSDSHRTEACRRSCVDVLLPLWQVFAANSVERKALRRCVRKGSRLAAWLEDPVGAAARGMVRICLEHGALDRLVRDSVPHLSREALIASALVLLDDQSLALGEPPLLQLPADLRAELLGALALCAEGEGEGEDDAEVVGALLRRCIALDRGGLLCLALSQSSKVPWADGSGGDQKRTLHRSLVPLIKQACWVSPALREKAAARLRWRSGPASAVFELAVCLDSLGPEAPVMEALIGAGEVAELDALKPSSLRPLPSEPQLRKFLAVRPEPRLVELLRQVAAEAPGSEAAELGEASARAAGGEAGLLEALAAGEACLAPGKGPSAEALLALAGGICQGLVALEDQVCSKKCRKALRSLTQAMAGASPRAAATLLSGLLAFHTSSAGDDDSSPPSWQCELAAHLVGGKEAASGEGHEELLLAQPTWFLSHVALWWFHLRTTPQRKRLLGRIRRSYSSSYSADDRIRRRILLHDAAGDDAVESPLSSSAGAKRRRPWSFRAWCGSLCIWGDGGPWSWTLDPQRVRATVDAFCFSRPMVEEPPWLHAGGDSACGATSGEAPAAAAAASGFGSPASPTEQAYDIGYLAPFLAGQLRALWAEHRASDGSSGGSLNDTRAVLGPVLGALASGGALELLLLALACDDRALRASAQEALAVFVAMAMLWSDTAEDASDSQRRTRQPFRELPQVVRLLQYARDSLEPPQKERDVPAALPRLVAAFLSACQPVLCQPGHFLYMRVGLALCGQASADLGDVPIFYKLLLSGEAESHETRVWFFRVVRRALAGGRLGGQTGQLPAAPMAAAPVEASGGDRFARVAFARRYVLQWLLSFASSNELGSFALWSEATNCLAAAVAEHGAGTPLGLGLAEWVSSQVARTWPGGSGPLHRRQALHALTRLVAELLQHSQLRVPPSSSPRPEAKAARTGKDSIASKSRTSLGAARCQGEALALGEALRSVAGGWREELRSNPANLGAPVAALWRSAHRLSQLARLCFVAEEGRDFAIDSSASCPDQSPAMIGRRACAAQLSAVMTSISGLAKARTGSPTPSSSSSSPPQREIDMAAAATGSVAAGAPAPDVSGRNVAEVLLLALRCEDMVFLQQAIELLEASPLSAVLHQVLVDLLRRMLGGAQPGLSRTEPSGRRESEAHRQAAGAPRRRPREAAPLEVLGDELQREIVLALGSVSMSIGNAAGEQKANLLQLLHALASLPYGPGVAWRVQVLVCSSLLQVFPDALPGKKLAKLAGPLPSPCMALAGLPDVGPVLVVDEASEASWRKASAALLGCLIAACG